MTPCNSGLALEALGKVVLKGSGDLVIRVRNKSNYTYSLLFFSEVNPKFPKPKTLNRS